MLLLYVRFVLKFAAPAPLNVLGTRTPIVSDARRRADDVQTNARAWRPETSHLVSIEGNGA